LERGKLGRIWCFLFLSFFLGCPLPPAPSPPLTPAAARNTLEYWNTPYFKVVEFYGLHQPAAANTRLAYVLGANPKEAAAKPTLYVAQFQLLTRPDGSQEWFLTSLLNHSGGLARRQGWDTLFLPLKTESATQAK